MMSTPTVEPTRAYQVVGSLAVGFGASWLLFSLLQGLGLSLPLVGPLAWISVAIITVWMLWLVRRTRVDVRTRALDARTALSRVILGKTSVMGGAGLAGAYAALIVLLIPAWPAPLAQGRILHAGIAIIMSVGWAVMGWRLQSACRIPPDDTPATPTGDRQSD